MQVTIGFYCGLARRLGKETEIALELPDSATLRNVSQALAARIPAFQGTLIDPRTYSLVEPHFFSVDGKRAPDLDTDLHPGDRILLMTVIAGG
jgi:molybdopterin converting factor small subunit